jgi:hypothetical protein
MRRLLLDGQIEGQPARHDVTITDFAPDNTLGNYCEALDWPDNELVLPGIKGDGSSSRIEFNPYRHSLPGANMIPNPDGSGTLIPDPADWRNRPPDVALEHEMNHANHNQLGDVDTGQSPDPVIGGTAPNEDLRTVGIGTHGESPTCENTYRAQRHLVPRTSYKIPPP